MYFYEDFSIISGGGRHGHGATRRRHGNQNQMYAGSERIKIKGGRYRRFLLHLPLYKGATAPQSHNS